jgi:predicted DNA-binding protein (MmcQ/YjbR family)
VTSVGLKCGRSVDDTAELRDSYPDDVSALAYIGRFGWCSVALAGAIPAGEFRELVDASYDAVVAGLPKNKRPKP